MSVITVPVCTANDVRDKHCRVVRASGSRGTAHIRGDSVSRPELIMLNFFLPIMLCCSVQRISPLCFKCVFIYYAHDFTNYAHQNNIVINDIDRVKEVIIMR